VALTFSSFFASNLSLIMLNAFHLSIILILHVNRLAQEILAPSR